MFTRTNPRLEAALDYADRGWAVFPVWWPAGDGDCACGKPKCKHPGKHPLGRLVPQGFKNATTDPVLIRQWWTEEPDANIGLVTGKVSGLVVLDIDGSIGEDTYKLSVQQCGPFPPTLEVKTGRGRHLYFALPDGTEVRTCDLGEGLELRAEGAYVIAPPSCHVSGCQYQVSGQHEMATCPAALLERTKPASIQPVTKRSADHVNVSTRAPEEQDRILEGGRDNFLTSVSGSLRANGLSVNGIITGLRAINGALCDPPISDDDLIRIANSIGSKAPFRTDGNGRRSSFIDWATLRDEELHTRVRLNRHLDVHADIMIWLLELIEREYSHGNHIFGWVRVYQSQIEKGPSGATPFTEYRVRQAKAFLKETGLLKWETLSLQKWRQVEIANRETGQFRPVVKPEPRSETRYKRETTPRDMLIRWAAFCPEESSTETPPATSDQAA